MVLCFYNDGCTYRLSKHPHMYLGMKLTVMDVSHCQVEFSAKQATEQLSKANEQLRVDVSQWHEAKNKEVSHFMRQFAANHMDYHQKVSALHQAHVHV